MARIFEYAVLTAIPDPRRGERVNVGVAIFREDRIDVRFEHATYKLRALTGENWDERLESARARYGTLFIKGAQPAEMLPRLERLEPLLKFSNLGWIEAKDEAQYEERVKHVVQSLVRLPRRLRGESRSRLNTEMARSFRSAQILARDADGVDQGKVVRDFPIDESEGLVADFALKNGIMHVASTLDLRKQSAGMGEAALKSIILDKAERKYLGQVRKIGIYATDPDMLDNFKSHISLLGEYADELYDWQDSQSRKRLSKTIFDAIGHAGNLV